MDQPLKADKMPAALLLPMGKDGPAFLAYPNFHQGLYEVEREPGLFHDGGLSRHAHCWCALSSHQGGAGVMCRATSKWWRCRISSTSKGYDVGKADGKIGAGTRAAVKAEQKKVGWPADSYPTPEFIAKLTGQ